MTKTINELYDFSPTSTFIFSWISSYVTDFDLWSSDVAKYLDMEYCGNFSGEKPIAPLVEVFIKDGELTEIEKSNLANIIWNRFKNKWERLSEDEALEYNPIRNYHIMQTEIPDITNTEEENSTLNSESSSSAQSSNNTSSSSEETESVNTNVVESIDTYGFNSSSAVPSAKNTTEANANDNITTNESSGEVDESGTSSATAESETTNSLNIVRTETGERTLETIGTTGNIPFTKLISDDINFWSKWNFVVNLFKDVDLVLTCPYYVS